MVDERDQLTDFDHGAESLGDFAGERRFIVLPLFDAGRQENPRATATPRCPDVA